MMRGTLYFLISGDYSVFNLPPQILYGDVTLAVQQRVAFTYGVKCCADARILLAALHVRRHVIVKIENKHLKDKTNISYYAFAPNLNSFIKWLIKAGFETSSPVARRCVALLNIGKSLLTRVLIQRVLLYFSPDLTKRLQVLRPYSPVYCNVQETNV